MNNKRQEMQRDVIVAICATLHLSLEDKIQDEDAQPMKIYVLSLSCHFSKEAKEVFHFPLFYSRGIKG